jgi:hypothetical protein
VQSGQVSVWVPIVVGLIGLAGVLVGQVLSMWREQRNHVIQAKHEEQQEERRNRREDQLHWRDQRLAVGVEFLVSLNAWRELTVDVWNETTRDGHASSQTRTQLSEVVIRMSDQLAHIKLIGTPPMSAAASAAVDKLLSASRATIGDLDALRLRDPELRAESAHLSAEVRRVRELFRIELGVTADRVASDEAE